MDGPQFARGAGQADSGAQMDAAMRSFMARTNTVLAERGMGIRMNAIQWMGSEDKGREVFFDDRGNKQLSSHWVPNDPRRAIGDSLPPLRPAENVNGIWWWNDRTEGAPDGTSAGATEDAFARAIATWEGQTCSELGAAFTGNSPFGGAPIDLGFVQWLISNDPEVGQDFGGFPVPLFDVTQGGFLPGAFFDTLIEDGSDFILGVTFTFIWVDTDTDVPTDIDNNGRQDTAFREIYYNDAFPWGIGQLLFDIETVGLHELGHALSQAHFGGAFQDGGTKGGIHFNPRAVVNSTYSGIQLEPTGTDLSGHCSNWAAWSEA